MIKKTITYDNLFTEQKVTEEHYFHISKADLIEMEVEEHKQEYVRKDGKKLTGMEAKLQRIVDAEDGHAILAEFKDMIRRSYGKKDGDRFRKSPEIWEEFSSSEAYSQLLFDLCTDAQQAGDFINGVVPGNLEQIAEEVRQRAAEVGKEALAESSEASAETPALAKAEAALNGDAPGSTGATVERLEAATPENPVVLTQAEMTAMDSDELQSGLATGRYKLS